jgi:transposase-like protein
MLVRSVGRERMDETCIKALGLSVSGRKAGRTVDFFLSRNRDVNAAKTFLRSAIKNTCQPTKTRGIASRGAGNEGDG